MQANLKRGKAASGVRSVGRFAILAGVPLIAALALSTSDPALAACGASRPAGVHAAASGGGSVHAATSIAAPSGGRRRRRKPRLCKRKQRLRPARTPGFGVGQGGRERRSLGGAHGRSYDEGHERHRASARVKAGASRLTGLQSENQPDPTTRSFAGGRATTGSSPVTTLMSRRRLQKRDLRVAIEPGALAASRTEPWLYVVHQHPVISGRARAHLGKRAAIKHVGDGVARVDHDEADRAGFEVPAIVTGPERGDRSA